MENKRFVNLHCHAENSLLDGIPRISDLVSKAKSLGYEFVGVTDHGNVDGLIDLQKECDKNNLISIKGAELYITENHLRKEKGVKSKHITIFVKNEVGWQNLLKMLTIANLEGFYYRPRISPKILLEHLDGLIISSACVNSFIYLDNGIELLLELQKRIEDDIYLEIMPHHVQSQLEHNKTIFELSKKYGIKLIATVDSHYLNKEDKEIHDVLLAMNSKTKMSDPNRWKFDDGFEVWYKTADEVIEAFKRQGQFDSDIYIKAMRETVKIAKKCADFRIEKKEVCLPVPPQFKGKDEKEELRKLCLKGMYNRVFDIIPPDYEERMNYELEILDRKGVNRYFLIVYDIISWCKENDILTGIGRGSVGSSLVAYLLGITNCDPIKYSLPFSRFLNEERIDLPDIDMDYPDNKRDLVINRLKELYGEYNVAGISTFLELKSRGIIRDVARVYDVPLDEVDKFSKSIPAKGTIDDALKSNDGQTFYDKHSKVIEYAKILENTKKAKSRHAAGIVVSERDLREGVNASLELRDDHTVVNWEMNDIENQGLLKFDFLGLNCLSILNEAKRLIKQNHNIDLNYTKLELDDKFVFEMINRGDTVGIFQFSTYDMTKLSKEMIIENFMHMVDAVALVRPGAKDSGITSEYIERQKGKNWEKKHPEYEKLLERTYGLYPFQEDIMNVVHKIAGLPYSTADQIRKIIGKKRDASEFEKYKQAFLDGCKNKEVLNNKDAEEFWENLQYSASYSFNLAHSIEYAMLGYYCGFLKVHYPTEFICASLSCGGETHKSDLVKEARRLGLKIIPPKVGLSDANEWITRGKNIYVPFKEIKGLGEKTCTDAANFKKKENGFYNTESKKEKKSKIEKILDEIKAFDIDAELPVEAESYFDFDLGGNIEAKYPKLVELIGIKFKRINIDDALNGNLVGLALGHRRNKPKRNKQVLDCNECELRTECKRPVLASSSEYNLMLVAEAPGRVEDKDGEVLIGPAGKELWKELRKYDLYRDMFYCTNTCKCWPSKSKTPQKNHIESCRHWLKEEIDKIKPFIILSLGNIPKYFFTREEGGITKLNGQTLWNEEYGCFIHYCVHPSSLLRDPKRRPDFEFAIQKFSEKIENLGGF